MTISKEKIFDQVRQMILDNGLSIVREDQSRPWGGFFVIDENAIDAFQKLYFQSVGNTSAEGMKLSPKILLVAPESRLSWQYHHRRAEVWAVIQGPVRVAISDTNEEADAITLEAGQSISLRQGQRHRLIGLKSWGIVAEIWQHINAAAPSDEDDIVRVQDDYHR